MVHARQVGGRVLDFGVSGALWNDALVMFDRQTRSLWSHVTGECIEGELEGARLTMMPAELVSFGEWVDRHPEALVLAKPSAEADSSKYADYAASDRQGIFGRLAKRAELDPKAVVQGVAFDGEAAALPHLSLAESALTSFSLAGRALVGQKAGGVVRIFEIPPGRDHGGAALEPVASTTAYWFAWLNFYPESWIVR